MSQWAAIETFLHGSKAKWFLRGLIAFTAYGVGSDYYVMHTLHVFPESEAERWVVDNSVIGRPRPVLFVLPSAHYTVYSPWTPRNGDVVLARALPENSHWIQLIGGRFLEKETCGAQLCVPESRYTAVQEERRNADLARQMEQRQLSEALQNQWRSKA
jgi:hypothetical protein